MNILYLGPESHTTTSRHRADALRRLGHEVESVDPGAELPKNRLMRQLNFRTGYRLFTGTVFRSIQGRVRNRQFDIAWVDGGHLISPTCVRWLKTSARLVVNYCIDDPTGPRDPSKWSTFCRAIPDYDVCVVVRDLNRKEYIDRGAKKVIRVMMSYDEVAHARIPYSAEDKDQWSSEAVFVGTWYPERGPFMMELIRRGVPLAIYGDRWHKAGDWKRLRPTWRGDAVYGQDYVKAVQYAKVAIGMLSKGNRDLHTQRSAETPFIGTAFCAERTSDHSQLLQEGEEALFWSGTEECATNCRALLADEPRRLRMASLARAKVQSLGLGNEAVCARILEDIVTEPGFKR